MEWTFKVKQLNDYEIEVIDSEFNLSPWTYNVLLAPKWHIVYIDGRVIKFNRDINYFFKLHNEDKREDKPLPNIRVSIDINEYKKLERIDKTVPGGIIPVMPVDDERIKKLETEMIQKQRQLLLLSSKIDNLEKLLKTSLGL